MFSQFDHGVDYLVYARYKYGVQDPVLMILVSEMLYPDSPLFAPIDKEIGDRCYSILWNVRLDDPEMSFGKARSVHIEIHEDCPSEPHVCKTDRSTVAEEWEKEMNGT